MTAPPVTTRVLMALKSADIKIDAVNYGGSPVIMMIAVPLEEYKQVIQLLVDIIDHLKYVYLKKIESLSSVSLSNSL